MAEGNVRVGDISKVSGEVSIAGGDIYKGFTSEEVTALLTQITTTFQPKPFDGRCPYKGLEAFEEADAELFYGRERWVDHLVEDVKESRTVFITGPSGNGKSSLVRAGLIPALKAGKIQGSERWLYETIKPGRKPGEALALAFSRLKSPELGSYLRENLGQPNALHESAESALSGQKGQRLVLFIDQFEEVFTQVSYEAERITFLRLLTEAAAVENGRVSLIFAMRSDFVSNCATYPELNALLNRLFVQIGAMQPDELVSAIAQPALRVGLRIDPDLIAQIISDMRGEPGTLPLMQFALKDLFEAEQAKGGLIVLTRQAYIDRGGIYDSLERHADASFAKLEKHEQELARSIFGGLIEIGRGTQDTRRTAVFDELVPANTNQEEVEAIVGKLADARLITTDQQAGKETVTISHEKLIDAWPWLKKLVNENREAIDLQNEITGDAREWDEHQRDQSYLYSGVRLANAHEQLNAKKLVLSGIAHDFVQAGYAKQQRERRTRILSVGGVIGLIILGIILFTFISVTNAEKLAEQSKNAANTQAALANTARDTAATAQAASTYAVNQQAIAQANAEAASTQEAIALKNADEAQRQSNIARSNLSRLLAKQALELLDAKNLEQALLIGLEAYRTSNTFEALNSLRVGLESSPYLYKTMRLQDISFGGISNNIAFDANGKLISAAWSQNLSIYSVDITTGEIRTLHEFYPGYMTDATFNSSGSLIALSTGGVPGIEIYNTMTGKPVGDRIQFENISPGNHRIADKFMFSPDGQTIAAVLTDDSLVFWDLTTHELKQRIEGIAYSPLSFYKDGKMIVLKESKSLNIMDIASGLTVDSPVTFEHRLRTKNLTVSPDQRTILLGVDRTPVDENYVILWDMVEKREITNSVPKEVDRIWSTAYGSDSELLAFTDPSSNLWVVDHSQNRPVELLMSGSFSLNGAISFTPDNQNLVVTNDSGDLLVVDIRPIHAIKRTIAKLENVKVSAMAFNPNNSILYTRDEEENVLGWDVSTVRTVNSSNNELAEFPKPGPEMKWDCLYPTRGGCTESKILLKDPAHGATQLNFGQGDVASLALSPDGKTLAVGILYDSNDAGRIHLIHTPDGKQAELTGFGIETITTLAFSPDGKFLAAGNQNGDIALYDLTSNEGLYPDPKVGDQTQLALEFAFSTDGQLLASASGDGITLWDTGSMRALVELPVAFKSSPETSPNLVFSSDKRWLAVRGETEVTLWNIDIENWQLRACQMAGRSFSDDEWETFFSDAPYQETCPNSTPKPEITPPP